MRKETAHKNRSLLLLQVQGQGYSRHTLGVRCRWLESQMVGFFPDVVGEREGDATCHAVSPLYKGVVFSYAAHVLHVALAVIIHGAGKALFDQTRHSGLVS